jgi:poly(3-hydroxybutyrate) depolymerase
MGGGTGAPTARPVPTIAIHGTADRTVAPANAVRLTAPLGAGAPKPRRRTQSFGGRRVTVTTVAAHDGHARAEHWQVDALAHAWSGGQPGGSHTDTAGPDASAAMVRFFLGA